MKPDGEDDLHYDTREERSSVSKTCFDGEGDVFIDYEEEENLLKLQLPFDIISVIFLVWLFYAVLFIVKATVTDDCTAVYWVLVFSIFPPLLFITYWVRLLRYAHMDFLLVPFNHSPFSTTFLISKAIKEVKRKQLNINGYILKGDLDITKGFPATVPLVVFAIGIMCNIVGIGGGELMGPLLLFLDIEPQVTSATSSLISLLSSSSNVFHYGVDNEIPLAVAAWMFPLGFAGEWSHLSMISLLF